jgi:hypothetical protein
MAAWSGALSGRGGAVTKGKLSDRQKRMLDFIQRFTAESGYPPSIREIGEAADISSTSVVNYNLNRPSMRFPDSGSECLARAPADRQTRSGG